MIDRLNSETSNVDSSNFGTLHSRTTDNNYGDKDGDDWLTEDEFVIMLDDDERGIKKKKKVKRRMMRMVMNTISGHRSGDDQRTRAVEVSERDRNNQECIEQYNENAKSSRTNHKKRDHNKYNNSGNNNDGCTSSHPVIGRERCDSMNQSESGVDEGKNKETGSGEDIELLSDVLNSHKLKEEENERIARRGCYCCCCPRNRYVNRFNELIISIASMIILLPITTTFLLISRTCD